MSLRPKSKKSVKSTKKSKPKKKQVLSPYTTPKSVVKYNKDKVVYRRKYVFVKGERGVPDSKDRLVAVNTKRKPKATLWAAVSSSDLTQPLRVT